jgi:hypothetical protein
MHRNKITIAHHIERQNELLLVRSVLRNNIFFILFLNLRRYDSFKFIRGVLYIYIMKHK